MVVLTWGLQGFSKKHVQSFVLGSTEPVSVSLVASEQFHLLAILPDAGKEGLPSAPVAQAIGGTTCISVGAACHQIRCKATWGTLEIGCGGQNLGWSLRDMLFDQAMKSVVFAHLGRSFSS